MIRQESFGVLQDKDISLFHLHNRKGDVVSITNYGGILTSWLASDRSGTHSNVLIGFEKAERYLPNKPNFGALIGRYANRIGGARFTLHGHVYELARNEGRNQLHGGDHNFTKAVWNAVIDEQENKLVLTHQSPDGEEGFPGNLAVKVSFHLNDDNELTIQYNASTDKDTHINLTSHPYFNLTADFSQDVLEHELMLHAHAYTPVDDEGIPTGLIAPATGTAYDFKQPKPIGLHLKEVDGYDINFVLEDAPEPGVRHAATLYEASTGRTLKVFTDQPGLQLYTSTSLDGSIATDTGIPLKKYAAVCLETQHFPDSPNQPLFPSTLLRAGTAFESTTRYRLGIDDAGFR